MTNAVAAAFLLTLTLNAATPVADKEFETYIEIQEKEYHKINAVDVPIAILREASSRYSGYSLAEAYKSEDGEYKMVLSTVRKLLSHITNRQEIL